MNSNDREMETIIARISYIHPPMYYRGVLWQHSERAIDIQVTRDLIKDYELALSFADQYNELLYAVGKKTPGEMRHETALRYIRQAEESHVGGPCNAETVMEEK